MKTILLTLTYLVGVGEFILAIYFWATHSKSEIRKVMALLAFSTAMWAITNGLTSYTNASPLITFYLALVYVFGILTVTCLLHLTIIFPYKTFNFDRLHTFFLYFPTILFGSAALTSSSIVSGYTINPEIPGYPIAGPLFIIYEIAVSAFFLASVALLIHKINKVDGFYKKITGIFLLGVVLGGLPAIILNLWFAFKGGTANPLVAVVFSIFWISATTYIILKK